MGIFSEIGNAKVNQGDGNFVRGGGEFHAKLVGVKSIQRNSDKKQLVMIEMRITNVVSTFDPGEGLYEEKGAKVPEPMRVGEDVTHSISQGVSFLSNFKQFLAAVMEMSPDDITEEIAERAISAEQPLEGVEIAFRCRTILTKAERKIFTKVHYLGPVGGEQQSEAEAA